MSIDLSTETMVPFPDAPSRIPGRPHIATVHRWRLRGVRGIKLESCLVGGKRFTSIEAIERFVERTTAAADGEQSPSRTPRQRQRAIKQAEQELAQAGI